MEIFAQKTEKRAKIARLQLAVFQHGRDTLFFPSSSSLLPWQGDERRGSKKVLNRALGMRGMKKNFASLEKGCIFAARK